MYCIAHGCSTLIECPLFIEHNCFPNGFIKGTIYSILFIVVLGFEMSKSQVIQENGILKVLRKNNIK